MNTVHFQREKQGFIKSHLDPFQLGDTVIPSQNWSPEIISTLKENGVSCELDLGIS